MRASSLKWTIPAAMTVIMMVGPALPANAHENETDSEVVLPAVIEKLEITEEETGVTCSGSLCELYALAEGQYKSLAGSMTTTSDPILRWLPLVAEFFRPEDVNLALTVIDCESEGDPYAKNPNSSASGLFQHLASAWVERAYSAGWEGADVFDPRANVAVAAWLVYQGGGWSHWSASEACWDDLYEEYDRQILGSLDIYMIDVIPEGSRG